MHKLGSGNPKGHLILFTSARLKLLMSERAENLFAKKAKYLIYSML